VSFINNPFHEEDISETAQLIACVFKEIVNEPGLGIINLQTDFATKKKRTNGTYFRNLEPSARFPSVK
jgi:hypothetical protein